MGNQLWALLKVMKEQDINSNEAAHSVFRRCQTLVRGLFQYLQLAKDLNLPYDYTIDLILPAIYAKAAIDELSIRLLASANPMRPATTDIRPVIAAKQAWAAIHWPIQLLLSQMNTWLSTFQQGPTQTDTLPYRLPTNRLNQLLKRTTTDLPPLGPPFAPRATAFSMLARVFPHITRTIRARQGKLRLPDAYATLFLNKQWRTTICCASTKAFRHMYPALAIADAQVVHNTHKRRLSQAFPPRLSSASTATPTEPMIPTPPVNLSPEDQELWDIAHSDNN
jgi:hypothetical protein